MCGISATLLYPQDRTAQEWQDIRDVFTRNLLFNEERGRAACGLAVIQADGETAMLKAPLPATEFIRTAPYAELLEKVGPRTTLLLGHTRLPTKGDPAWNENNHPIQAGLVFGVHNGRIVNDDDLFARFGFPRLAQVDSEIIFRMIEPLSLPVSPSGEGEYLEAINAHLLLLQGQFTFLACDTRRPGCLLVFKHNNPLCAHYHPGWQAIIFSSRYIFLRKAFGRILLVEALEHDALMLYDAALIPQRGMQPVGVAPLLYPVA